jgi:predicted acyl esterase
MTDTRLAPVTDQLLADIADRGVRAGGLTYRPAALSVSQALVSTLPGTASGLLTARLEQVVSDVRRVSAVGFPRITASDGTRLSAMSIKQSTAEPRPLVVMPAGWSPYGWLPCVGACLGLALRGYHVLAYTPRGIGTPGWLSASGGYIDAGGPRDWADGTSVIDYGERCFKPSAIGFLGESYGSGISQLVAAHDPGGRVSAVASLSTWGNLASALYDNGTRHLAALQALTDSTGGAREDKFDAATRQILADFTAGRNLDEVVAWGTERAPEAYADLTNARGIPTFISSTWHETLFPVGQAISLFTRLTVPKRLNLWIGDHGAPEAAALVSGPATAPVPGIATPVDEARAWLDRYLLGVDNGIDQAAVSSQVMFTYQTEPGPDGGQRVVVPATRETQPSWEDVTAGTERWYLGNDTPDGVLSHAKDTGWSRTFTAGELSQAMAVDAPLTTGQQEWSGSPRVYKVSQFERDRLLIWQSEPLGGRRIRGTPAVQLTVRSTAHAATLVAYLFDVAPDGTSHIITHEPRTLTALRPGEDVTVRWHLRAACYDISPGHRLALVVNSRDALYAFTGTPESTTTISSPCNTESYLDLALG